MKNLILNILKQSEQIGNFKLATVDVESYQLFFVHDKVETVRNSTSRTMHATVYCEHDGALGSSSFEVNASMSEQELVQKVQQAREQALLIFDKPYVLPPQETLCKQIESDIAQCPFEDVAAKVANAVFSAKKADNCAVNALEVFVNKVTTNVINGNGLDKTQTSYNVFVEAIPTCNGEEQSAELYENFSLGEADLDSVQTRIQSALENVEARLHAGSIEHDVSCTVLLNSHELRQLVSELVDDVNYASVYNRSNLHSIGDSLQTNAKYDHLNVWMRGVCNGCANSRLFDEDGTTCEDRQIIKDGELASGWGGTRYAQYLNERASGNMNIVQIESGKTSVDEMRAGKHLEIVSMSGIQVDLYNDYIGGEVRLAYYFDGKQKRAVTGFSISAKLGEVLSTIKLSKECVKDASYCGPALAAFEGFVVY